MQNSQIISLSQPSYRFLHFALFASLFMVIFNYTLTNMAAIYIVGDLGGSNDIASYTISFYAVGNAVGVPLGRGFFERVGILRLFIWSMLLFALFSLLCGIAPNWPIFITCRFIQGVVAGPIYVLTGALLTAFTPPNKKERFTSITIGIFTAVPALAASWGGWFAYDYSWRWNFYMDVPILLLLVGYVWYRLKGFDKNLKKTVFDWIGYFFFFVGVFSLSCVIILGQELDWFRSPIITGFAMIGIPCFIFFVLWELKHPHAVIELRLLKNPTFSFALINLAVLFSVYFGTIILLALWLGLYVNYTPIWVGVLVGTMFITSFFPLFLTEKQFGHRDTRIFLVCSIVLLSISCFQATTFNEQINFGRIATSRILAGIGFGLFLSPVFRLCFRSFTAETTFKVTGVFQIVRALGSGLGASIFTTVWLRRQVFYHDRLGGQLTIYSPETKQFFIDAKGFHIQGSQADAFLEDFLQRRATALALEDTFWLMGWMVIALLFLLALSFFIPPKFFNPEKKEPDICASIEE